MKRKNGFTLIELIAVLVILAILALIVTPLVMNIIRKAKISADRRSVDAYGRSVELAIAGYLLDTGTFPTSMNQLTVEYKGDEVVCSTTQIKSDSSVYLAGCTVGGRSVDGYTYGSEEAAPTYTAYSIGDEVKYNNVDYYVIKDSSINEKTVTLLKAVPLTTEEVNQYGVGHVNRYTSDSVGTAYNLNGYGKIAYYTSESCGVVNGEGIYTGCTTDYEQSEIKYVVDAWASANVPEAVDARLITYEELTNDLGCISDRCSNSPNNWLYSDSYASWTSSQHPRTGNIWYVSGGGSLDGAGVQSYYIGSVRPVITVNKSALES